MSILVDENTRVVVQGITGKEGSFHTRQMLDYGTVVAAGVTPGKGGQEAEGVPVFNTVKEAVEKEGVNTSCIFVPPPFAADAIMESSSAGMNVIVCITEGIPALDMVKVADILDSSGSVLIGPNCPGIISPGKTKVGIMPGPIHNPGHVGVISRSGTLTYEVVDQLTRVGLGQSTCIGIGGDAIVGTSFIDHLKKFGEDRIEATFHSEAYEKAKQLRLPLIHWIPADTGIPCEVVMPNATITKGMAEEESKNLSKDEIIQFERFGFVRINSIDKKIIASFAHK